MNKQKGFDLISTMWGSAGEQVKLTYLYKDSSRPAQFKEWDPNSICLLMEPLFSKNTDYRQMNTVAFVGMIAKYKQYVDVLLKMSNPIARQLATGWMKLTADGSSLWAKPFVGELCQLKLAGNCGNEIQIPK